MTTLPIGLSRDLPPNRVMRAQVASQDLVVWRAPGGQIAAWDNRCPHRGMALSHGFVRGGMLACLYHGWHYGPDGACKAIPAHPDLEPPETIRARAFAAAEATGVIWVALEGAATVPALPDGLAPLRSLEVNATPEAVATAGASTPWKGTAPVADGAILWLKTFRVMILTNPVGRSTQVTCLTDKTATPADCAALSRWCEAMRRRAEAAA